MANAEDKLGVCNSRTDGLSVKDDMFFGQSLSGFFVLLKLILRSRWP